MNPLSFPLLISVTLALAACDRPAPTVANSTPIPEPVARTSTLETKKLGRAVDLYEANPTAGNKADVEKALADLDGEIAELEGRVAKTDGADRQEAAAKLKNLQSYRQAEALRFAALQAKAPVTSTAPSTSRSAEDKVKDTAEKIGDSVGNAAETTRDALRDAVK